MKYKAQIKLHFSVRTQRLSLGLLSLGFFQPTPPTGGDGFQNTRLKEY